MTTETTSLSVGSFLRWLLLGSTMVLWVLRAEIQALGASSVLSRFLETVLQGRCLIMQMACPSSHCTIPLLFFTCLSLLFEELHALGFHFTWKPVNYWDAKSHSTSERSVHCGLKVRNIPEAHTSEHLVPTGGSAWKGGGIGRKKEVVVGFDVLELSPYSCFLTIGGMWETIPLSPHGRLYPLFHKPG